jgi:hypothetical protein
MLNEYRTIYGNKKRQGKPNNSKKTCPNATLFTINPIWADVVLNSGHSGGKWATNRLSYGSVSFFFPLLHPSVSSFPTPTFFGYLALC